MRKSHRRKIRITCLNLRHIAKLGSSRQGRVSARGLHPILQSTTADRSRSKSQQSEAGKPGINCTAPAISLCLNCSALVSFQKLKRHATSCYLQENTQGVLSAQNILARKRITKCFHAYLFNTCYIVYICKYYRTSAKDQIQVSRALTTRAGDRANSEPNQVRPASLECYPCE